MANSELVRLPRERVDQLRALSKALDIPISDVIGRMIRREIADGTIPSDIPGVQVALVGEMLSVQLEGGMAVSMTTDSAMGLADTLARVAKPGRREIVLDLDAGGVEIEHIGTAVRLKVGGTQKAFSRDVTRDIADLIADTADA